MKSWMSVSAAVALAAVLDSGVALGQVKPADCPKAEKVEGQVVKVDQEQGKITLRAADGKTYEFNGTKEILQDKKVGDRMELTRRMPEHCK